MNYEAVGPWAQACKRPPPHSNRKHPDWKDVLCVFVVVFSLFVVFLHIFETIVSLCSCFESLCGCFVSFCSRYESLCNLLVCLCASFDSLFGYFGRLWPIALVSNLYGPLFLDEPTYCTSCTVSEMQQWGKRKHNTCWPQRRSCALVTVLWYRSLLLFAAWPSCQQQAPPSCSSAFSANGSTPSAHVPHKWRTDRRHGDLAVVFTAWCLLRCACGGKISNSAFFLLW